MTHSAQEIYPELLFPKGIALEKLGETSVAVLVSGGVESASLVWALTQYFASVQPVYVRFGLVWEKIEQQCLLQYLDAVAQPGVEPLKVFDMPMDNIYGKHWSTTGYDVPDANTEDEAVYLPGRNLLLLAQTAVWCALNQIHFIALGSLGTNPFPDASPQFFDQLQNTLTAGLNFNINILRPFSAMHKHEVILLAKDLPLHLTFSCINPVTVARGARTYEYAGGHSVNMREGGEPSKADGALHCGLCNKCAERQKAFLEAQIEDRTIYASSQLVTIKTKELNVY